MIAAYRGILESPIRVLVSYAGWPKNRQYYNTDDKQIFNEISLHDYTYTLLLLCDTVVFECSAALESHSTCNLEHIYKLIL